VGAAVGAAVDAAMGVIVGAFVGANWAVEPVTLNVTQMVVCTMDK